MANVKSGLGGVFLGMLMSVGMVHGQATAPVVPAGLPAWISPNMKGGTEMLLWADTAEGKNGAPAAMGETLKDRPTLRVYLPARPNATKSAVIVAPGGGYSGLAMQHEGDAVAQWLNAKGVAAFVLRYRVAPYRHPVEIGDAHRAIRTVRMRAAEWGIDPAHIGFMGFSAGGHLASTTATHYDAGDAGSADAIERMSSRPDFVVLCYAVVSMNAPYMHAGSRKNLLGENPSQALVDELSNDLKVTPDTPPTYLFHTSDDPVVPVMNSVLFYTALVKNKVPAEMHLYQHGPHGVGLAPSMPDLKDWPETLAAWMRGRGLMER